MYGHPDIYSSPASSFGLTGHDDYEDALLGVEFDELDDEAFGFEDELYGKISLWSKSRAKSKKKTIERILGKLTKFVQRDDEKKVKKYSDKLKKKFDDLDRIATNAPSKKKGEIEGYIDELEDNPDLQHFLNYAKSGNYAGLRRALGLDTDAPQFDAPAPAADPYATAPMDAGYPADPGYAPAGYPPAGYPPAVSYDVPGSLTPGGQFVASVARSPYESSYHMSKDSDMDGIPDFQDPQPYVPGTGAAPSYAPSGGGMPRPFRPGRAARRAYMREKARQMGRQAARQQWRQQRQQYRQSLPVRPAPVLRPRPAIASPVPMRSPVRRPGAIFRRSVAGPRRRRGKFGGVDPYITSEALGLENHFSRPDLFDSVQAETALMEDDLFDIMEEAAEFGGAPIGRADLFEYFGGAPIGRPDLFDESFGGKKRKAARKARKAQIAAAKEALAQARATSVSEHMDALGYGGQTVYGAIFQKNLTKRINRLKKQWARAEAAGDLTQMSKLEGRIAEAESRRKAAAARTAPETEGRSTAFERGFAREQRKQDRAKRKYDRAQGRAAVEEFSPQRAAAAAMMDDDDFDDLPEEDSFDLMDFGEQVIIADPRL
jgi:hypothetical protein